MNTVLAPDVEYAPPSFDRARLADQGGSDRIVFVDFTEAHYEIRIERLPAEGEVGIKVRSTLEFEIREDGLPIFCLRQPMQAVSVDGVDVEVTTMRDPDGASRFNVVEKVVPAGRHTLKVDSIIDQLVDSDFDPIQWVPRPEGVQCIFRMSDRGAKKGFLDSYLPSNFEYDHIKMSVDVSLHGVDAVHRMFGNGKIDDSVPNRWRISYPKSYTSSSILFHLAPASLFEVLETEYVSGNHTIPIEIYAQSLQVQFETIRLQDYADSAIDTLRKLEQQFGRFPHPKVIIYAEGDGKGGMEYAGAAITHLDSVRHELDHSYFARSVTPANGNAGWVDEAIAAWGDGGYVSLAQKPTRRANIAGRSPYERTTSAHAYTIGRDFLAHLDHKLTPGGGMKAFLKDYFENKKGLTVSTAEFQDMVKVFHGDSLDALFDEFVNGAQVGNGTIDVGESNDPGHH